MVIVGNFPNRFSIATFSSNIRYLKVSAKRERSSCSLVYILQSSASIIMATDLGELAHFIIL